MISASGTAPGTVYLVGAGPGDPGLITLRAVECLGRADVVLYDYLVNPVLLEHAPASAELICLGHHSTGRALAPDEITAHMVEEALQGKAVVRLKGGDPSVFGRGADEVGALRGAGIPYEIVPGITTGLAAAAFCEIPVTHHDDASAVALVAGQERHCKEASSLDYGALARFPGTLVFYMGVKRVSQWSRCLVEQGKPPQTPVAIVRRCSWPEQRTIRCTLATVAEVVDREGLAPPAVFVVGPVVDRAPQLSWFAARPLFGVRVLVAGRPRAAKALRNRLAALGAAVIVQPTVHVTGPADWAPLDAALDAIDQYDGLALSSGPEVDCLCRRLLERCGDVRRLSGVKLVALCRGAAERLARYHLRADVQGASLPAGRSAQALVQQTGGRRFLVLGREGGRRRLARALRRAGARVDRAAVCAMVEVESPDPEVVAEVSAGRMDWVAVTGPDSARSLVRLCGEALRGVRIASSSRRTTAVLDALGRRPAAEALQGTTSALVDAILRAGSGDARCSGVTSCRT